jgi:acetyltransferase-like isoleucine patch superfamily enzyme
MYELTMEQAARRIFVSPRAELGQGVVLGDDVQIFGPARIEAGTWVDNGVVIGYPSPLSVELLRMRPPEGFLDLTLMFESAVDRPTWVGPGSFIRRGTVIYEGCRIGAHLDCAHQVVVREGCTIDSHVELGPLTYLKRDCQVGEHSRIATSICDRTIVGRHCTVYGRTVHKFLSGVSGVVEPAPILEDGVVVGREACVVGPVVLGRLSLVGAGAVVTESVPAESVVAGNPARWLRPRRPEEAPELWKRVTGEDGSPSG